MSVYTVLIRWQHTCQVAFGRWILRLWVANGNALNEMDTAIMFQFTGICFENFNTTKIKSLHNIDHEIMKNMIEQ